MKIRDKQLNQSVDVADSDCEFKPCYWARPDPGVFVPGSGYKQRSTGSAGWLCGTREIRGCPIVPPVGWDNPGIAA